MANVPDVGVISTAIRARDMTRITNWICEGCGLFKGNDFTIYHYLVLFSDSVDFMEEVLRIFPQTVDIITRGSMSGRTCLHHCCYQARDDDGGHTVGLLDVLCRAAGVETLGVRDEEGQTCEDWAGNNDGLRRFIVWRTDNPDGLPYEVRKMNNATIYQYVRALGSITPDVVSLYTEGVKGKTDVSLSIRLVFLGLEMTGKTTLMLRMSYQDPRLATSTNQLDVMMNALLFDMVTGERLRLEKWMEPEIVRQRLKNVASSHVSAADIRPSGETDRPKGATALPSSLDVQTERRNEATVLPSSLNVRAGRLEETSTLPSSVNIRTDGPKDATVLPSSVDVEAEAAMVMTGEGPFEENLRQGRTALVHVFDFGGELMFSTFQHIFLNRNCVAILVVTLHDCLQHDAILDRVYFWLKFLSTFNETEERYHPPVILVGTHLDRVPEDERTTIKQRVIKRIKRDPKLSKAYDQHVLAFVITGKTERDEYGRPTYDNMDEVIWGHVREAAKYQSHWAHLLPAKWIALERDIMLLRSQGVKVMTLDEVKVRAQRFIVPLGDNDVRAMLEYMHVSRSIMAFALDSQAASIIISPEWLIHGLRLIVTVVKFQKDGVDYALLEEYRSTKRLTLAFVKAVWARDTTEQFLKYQDVILFYLNRLELIVKPLPAEGETSVDYYIVPCLLDEANPQQVRPLLEQETTSKSSTLCFDFLGKYIPPAVSNKIIAACIHRFEILSHHGTQILQQGLACFAIRNDQWKLVLHCKDSQLKITLFSDRAEKVKAGDGYNIRVVFEAIINATLERNQQSHLTYRYLISGDFEVDGNEEMDPVEKYGMAEHLPVTYTVWFSQQNEIQELSETNSEECSLRRIPSPREIIRIAKYLPPKDHELFFVHLGMDDVRIQQLRYQFEKKMNFRSVLARIAIVWNSEAECENEIINIRAAFDYCKLNFYDFLRDILGLSSPRDDPMAQGMIQLSAIAMGNIHNYGPERFDVVQREAKVNIAFFWSNN